MAARATKAPCAFPLGSRSCIRSHRLPSPLGWRSDWARGLNTSSGRDAYSGSLEHSDRPRGHPSHWSWMAMILWRSWA